MPGWEQKEKPEMIENRQVEQKVGEKKSQGQQQAPEYGIDA